jgi:hypothetical protein
MAGTIKKTGHKKEEENWFLKRTSRGAFFLWTVSNLSGHEP